VGTLSTSALFSPRLGLVWVRILASRSGPEENRTVCGRGHSGALCTLPAAPSRAAELPSDALHAQTLGKNNKPSCMEMDCAGSGAPSAGRWLLLLLFAFPLACTCFHSGGRARAHISRARAAGAAAANACSRAPARRWARAQRRVRRPARSPIYQCQWASRGRLAGRPLGLLSLFVETEWLAGRQTAGLAAHNGLAERRERRERKESEQKAANVPAQRVGLPCGWGHEWAHI